MGKLNFRKSFKLGPININLSGKGVGASVGVPGARLTQRADGVTQLTTSIPGTGITQRTTLGGGLSESSRSSTLPPLPYSGLSRGTGERPQLTHYLIEHAGFSDATPEIFALSYSEYAYLTSDDRPIGCIVVSQNVVNIGMSKFGYSVEGAAKYIFLIATAATNYYFDNQLFIKTTSGFGVEFEDNMYAVIDDGSSHMIIMTPDEAKALGIHCVFQHGSQDMA